MNERKNIAQILAERKALTDAENEKLRQIEAARNRALLAKQKQEMARIKEQMAQLLPEAKRKFIKKWELESVISDLQEYFGPTAHVDLERMQGEHPSPDRTYGFDSSQESINYLSHPSVNKLAVVVWSGDSLHSAGYGNSAGKRISFFETGKGDLLIFPGSNWSLKSCPLLNHWTHKISREQPKQVFSSIQDAILGICETHMEDWHYSAPTPTEIP